jgi:flagellar hook assembly protein FlgD
MSLFDVTGIMDHEAGGRPSDRALSVFPSVARRRATVVLNVPDARAACRLQVYDARGRVVRDFGLQSSKRIVSWDLRDDRDRDLPAGVYFIRLVTGNRVVTDKAVIVRGR